MKYNTQNNSRAQASGNKCAGNEGDLGAAHNRLQKFTPTQHTPLANPDTIIPIIDNVGFSVCYGSMTEFERFKNIVESDTGEELKPRRLDSVMEWHCPSHGVYLVPPEKDISHRWGSIHFEPSIANFSQVQSWIEGFLGTRKHTIHSLVKLNMIELAYDIPCPSESEACTLAKRIARHIWPRHARTTYTTIVTGKQKRVSDGAINGTQTVYVQSGKRADAGMSSDDMNMNLEATGHTKIYPKELGWQQYLRLEIKLLDNRANALMDGCYQDFTCMLDVARSIPFSKFWIFRQANIDKFKTDWKAKVGFNVKRIMSTNLPANTMPVADQIRLMRAAAKVLGKNMKVQNYIFDIPFSEAIAQPLPEGFRISPRLVKEKQNTKNKVKSK